MYVWVRRLDGPVEAVLVRLGDDPLAEVPLDLRPGQRLDLALEVQQVALLGGNSIALKTSCS